MKDNKQQHETLVLKLEQQETVNPEVQVKANDDWVLWGKKHEYPFFLADLFDNSGLHSAIVESKIDYSAGDGVTYEGKEEDSNTKTDQLIEEASPGVDFETFFRKILTDYINTGNYCFSVIPQKGDPEKLYYYHYSITDIAPNKQNSKGQVEQYWYSKDWRNVRKQENKPIPIAAYGFGKKNEEQMVFYKDYRMNHKYYGLPSYNGATRYIEVDIEIGVFHLANLHNGMSPSSLINYYNVPEGTERDNITRQWKDKKAGAKNTGKFILSFNNSKDDAPTVETMQASNLDKQFAQLAESTLQQILSGHRITSPLLVGIKTEGQLGGTSELVEAFNLFYATVIDPIQKRCLKEINKINKKYGYEELEILTNKPVEFTWGENILNQILTEEEMREMSGFEAKKVVEPIKEGTE